MLRKLALSLALVACAALPLGGIAEASIADSPFSAARQMTGASPVQDALFIQGGIAYCWYPSGWHGPGFYRCGWQWRTGVGWGGGWGWNGWGGGWNSGWNGRGWHRGMRPPHRRPHHRPAHRPGHGGNRPSHGGNRPGGHRPGGGNRPPQHRPGGGGGQRHRGGGGGGNRRHTDLPSIPHITATATFAYVSAGAAAYTASARF
jgi:hypothetical protein